MKCAVHRDVFNVTDLSPSVDEFPLYQQRRGSDYSSVNIGHERSRVRRQIGIDGAGRFRREVHFGQGGKSAEVRYSPAECTGIRKRRVEGNPDERHVSTSHVERMNLSIRMQNRRFTRLTNGFSKKLANHCSAVAIHFMHYNFCRVHKTLRVTPAMEAGLADHVWELSELVGLLEAREMAKVGTEANKRGRYRPRVKDSN